MSTLYSYSCINTSSASSDVRDLNGEDAMVCISTTSLQGVQEVRPGEGLAWSCVKTNVDVADLPPIAEQGNLAWGLSQHPTITLPVPPQPVLASEQNIMQYRSTP